MVFFCYIWYTNNGDRMKALITGASSGIGRDFARILSNNGYDLILVARNEEPMEDLSSIHNVKKLYNQVKNENIDILINDAGFGLIGSFRKTDLDKELSMIDLNIKAVHILTKLFLDDFVKKDSGYILNVSSSSAFQPGPLMATYYSTKVYVHHLTLAIYEELRRMKSNVHISSLCPGPVKTNFNNVADCDFKIKALSSEYVASYAIDKMFKNKLIIIPGVKMKLVYMFGRFLPSKLKLKLTYNIQYRKTKKKDYKY